MSPLQPPSHCACAPAATLSSCAASAGRVSRHESAACFAFEFGLIQNAAPAMGLPVTGSGGAGVESVGPVVGFVPPFLFLASIVPSGEVASPEHAASAAIVVTAST